MALILARSPYSISRGLLDSGAILTVEIGNLVTYTFYSVKTYSLNFRNQQFIDISPLIRDYLLAGDGLVQFESLMVRVTKTGSIGGVPQTPTIETHTAVDGYSFYEDGWNKDFSDELAGKSYYAGSNNVIYRYADKPLSIPILKADNLDTDRTYVSYYYNDTLISTVYLATSGIGGSGTGQWQNTNLRVRYITESLFDDFQERVEYSGASFEDSYCFQEFEEDAVEFTANKVVISTAYLGSDIEEGAKLKPITLTIVPVEECKYEPHKLVFLNKYGVKEDLWFFKKSTKSMEVSKENYRTGSPDAYIYNRDLSHHTYKDYNVNGRESMVLNTGFVPESFNENIKQLMLSERVWIDSGVARPNNVAQSSGSLLPVNIKDSSIELKQSVNDKLINYTIEIDFSYDTINNVF